MSDCKDVIAAIEKARADYEKTAAEYADARHRAKIELANLAVYGKRFREAHKNLSDGQEAVVKADNEQRAAFQAMSEASRRYHAAVDNE